MDGVVQVLNVGAGDIEVRFNQHQPEERARAIKMLQDMQHRGYAILIRLPDGSYTRALEVDAERGCYIISDPPPVTRLQLPASLDAEDDAPLVEAAPLPPVDAEVVMPRRRGRPRKSVPIDGTTAVGVARSAGG